MRVAPVSNKAKSQLLAKAHHRTEPKGAVLFRTDEPSFGVFLVRKGSVSLRLESAEGIAILNRIASPDSLIGLPATLSGARYSLTAIALEQSELAFLDRGSLIDLIKNDPGFGLELMHALGDEVVQMRTALASSPAPAVM